MKNLKGFSLLEMMMVIVVISILVFVMKPFFQSNNKDFLYMESCINKVYGDLNNYMYAAATSKAIISGTNRIFPTKYTINIINSGKVNLEYTQSDGRTGLYLQDYLSGLSDYYCKTKNYYSVFSGDLFSLNIDKSNQTTTNRDTQGYTVTGTKNQFSGSTSLYLCYNAKTCIEMANFEIDIRTQKLKKKKCINLGGLTGSCPQRDQ